jgi:hypothetical protein
MFKHELFHSRSLKGFRMRRLNYDMLNIIVAVQRLRSFMIADSAIREAAGQENPSLFKSAGPITPRSPTA